jgi:SH3-like domain-containing protein
MQYKDTRVNVFDVDVQLENDHRVILNGKILEEQMVQALQAAIYGIHPAASVDSSGLKVLVKKANHHMIVNTNLTGLYAGPSFQDEQLNQLVFGMQVEILETNGVWGFVRQSDGYLSWMYLPYLSETILPTPTHIVIDPVVLVREEADQNAPIAGRIFAGTPIVLEKVNNDWAFVTTTVKGWVKCRSLRSIEDFPQTIAERRKLLEQDAKPFIGTPYEWGGCSANGIDCSGYAQLVYRLAGISIRRDADMQFNDGKKKESSFEPGDLVFFGEKEDGQDHITHVGISLGDWSMIHSSRARNGVYIDNILAVLHLRESFLFGCSYF